MLENNTVEEGLVIKTWEQEKDRGGLFLLPVEAEHRIRGVGGPLPQAGPGLAAGGAQGSGLGK